MLQARLRKLLSVAPVVALIAGSGALQATTILAMDAANLVDQAEAVVVGSVTGIRPVISPLDHAPYHLITLRVEETLKGRVEDKDLTLRLSGGPIDGSVVEVVGMPRFDLGVRYLLFVAGNGRFMSPILGWEQGQLRFARHPQNGEPILVNASGRALRGLVDGRWLASSARLMADGGIVLPRTGGVSLLSASGVSISMPKDVEADSGPSLGGVAPAAQLLADLRRLIRQRRSLPSFSPGKSVSLATPFPVLED